MSHHLQRLAQSRGHGARPHRARLRQALPGQLAFGFLQGLPLAERRVQRAFRPHLRGRTLPAAEQLVLPLRSPASTSWYCGIEASYLEAALRAARAGSREAVAEVVRYTRPEVEALARSRWRPGCPLSVEELTAEGLARILERRSWEDFEPGRAPGRTLWPAFARRVAGQAMGDALQAAGSPVRVTRWARRVTKAAAARTVGRERVEYRGFDTRKRLVRRVTARAVVVEVAPQAVAVELHEDLAAEGSRLEDLALQSEALEHLAGLPVRQRVAVAGPLGLLREGVLLDGALSRHLHCSPGEVASLRAEGLAQLRANMEASCR